MKPTTHTKKLNKQRLIKCIKHININNERSLRSLIFEAELRLFYLEYPNYDESKDLETDLGFSGSYCEHEG